MAPLPTNGTDPQRKYPGMRQRMAPGFHEMLRREKVQRQVGWFGKPSRVSPVVWSFAILFTCTLTCWPAGAARGSTLTPSDSDNARQVSIQTPPMGWSSWNSFSNTVDSAIVVDQAN